MQGKRSSKERVPWNTALAEQPSSMDPAAKEEIPKDRNMSTG